MIDCNGDESDAIDIIIHDRQYTPPDLQPEGRAVYPYGVLTEVTAPTGELSLAVLSHGSVAHRKVSDTA